MGDTWTLRGVTRIRHGPTGWRCSQMDTGKRPEDTIPRSLLPHRSRGSFGKCSKGLRVTSANVLVKSHPARLVRICKPVTVFGLSYEICQNSDKSLFMDHRVPKHPFKGLCAAPVKENTSSLVREIQFLISQPTMTRNWSFPRKKWQPQSSLGKSSVIQSSHSSCRLRQGV